MKSIWSRLNGAARPLWLLFALATLWLAGCGGVEDVVEVGLVAPFEGRYRAIGYDVIYSARMVVREVNAAGGIGRYRVELVAMDDFGDPEMARQTAQALVIDPDVVAVVGHWLPDTTAAATGTYQRAGMAHLAAGSAPLGPVSAVKLPAWFRSSYAEVTPFDEEAGEYAGAAYDGLHLVTEAMRIAWEESGRIDRDSVLEALEEVSYSGVTGTVSQP